MRHLTLLLFAVCSHVAAADVRLSDTSYLRKLSLHIRGVSPAAVEYADLEKLASTQDKDAFFQNKISEYLASPEHEDRLVFQLSEMFGVRTPDISHNSFIQLGSQEQKKLTTFNGIIDRDSLTDLFARMARQNLSWDQLLIGKDYVLYAATRNRGLQDMTDFSFFRPVIPNLPAPILGPLSSDDELPPDPGIPVKFADGDSRVAGALTSPRFLSRYTTTFVNKNRRRAAAVFRIFLCDPMSPVFPAPADRKNAELPVVFDDQGPADHGAATEADLNRHGSDPRCVVCHSKLDPLGKSFQNIGIALNPLASRGALVIKRAGGDELNVSGNGIGDLAAAIIKQPEYVNCQVDWFIRQYFGADVLVSAERKAELIQSFGKLGRKTSSFIEYLVAQPEFRMQPENSETVSFARVKPLLQRCDHCHQSNDEAFIPEFAVEPIDAYFLDKMQKRLNLPDSDPHRMPRDWRMWNPDDIEIVKRWLKQGAHR